LIFYLKVKNDLVYTLRSTIMCYACIGISLWCIFRYSFISIQP